jgi:hypothetical protein
MSDSRAILCPYCGDRQVPAHQCRSCGGRFDVWSLQATQNEMGAWYVRDPRRPHFVGFGYEALCASIRSGEIGRDAIVRGPSTRQLWTIARRAPGLAHLFGRCYACQSPLGADDAACQACGAETAIDGDRNFFGLPAHEPIAPPANARPDHSAFVVDSGLLVVRAVPVRSPARTVVRVAAPVAGTEPASADLAMPDAPRPVAAPAPDPAAAVASAAAPVASAAALAAASVASAAALATAAVPATSASAAPRSALSPIDRGLIERTRRLETWNRVLFGTTAAGFAFALLFGFAYFLEINERRSEVEAARKKGAEDVRSEFERSAPVVVPPPAELPPMPSEPAAGGGGAKGSSGANASGAAPETRAAPATSATSATAATSATPGSAAAPTRAPR